MVEVWTAILDFFETGGDVLVAIAGVTFLMWTLIIERYWYFFGPHRRTAQDLIAAWKARRERSSWYAHQIRRTMLSRMSLDLNRNIALITTLVALCPLLGLLGTVTGMVEVFDVMALAGSGNPRAMASGVSRATIPTMAGMVAALSGFILSIQLQRRAERETEHIADQLRPEGNGR